MNLTGEYRVEVAEPFTGWRPDWRDVYLPVELAQRRLVRLAWQGRTARLVDRQGAEVHDNHAALQYLRGSSQAFSASTIRSPALNERIAWFCSLPSGPAPFQVGDEVVDLENPIAAGRVKQVRSGFMYYEPPGVIVVDLDSGRTLSDHWSRLGLQSEPASGSEHRSRELFEVR